MSFKHDKLPGTILPWFIFSFEWFISIYFISIFLDELNEIVNMLNFKAGEKKIWITASVVIY